MGAVSSIRAKYFIYSNFFKSCRNFFSSSRVFQQNCAVKIWKSGCTMKCYHPFPRFFCRPVPKVLPRERKINPQKSDIKIWAFANKNLLKFFWGMWTNIRLVGNIGPPCCILKIFLHWESCRKDIFICRLPWSELLPGLWTARTAPLCNRKPVTNLFWVHNKQWVNYSTSSSTMQWLDKKINFCRH